MVLSGGDRRFLTQVAMPTLGIYEVTINASPSTARWPDIWTDGHTITVTREWERQGTVERRKRLVHELLHLQGLRHGRKGRYYYSTYPSKDTYSMIVYQQLTKHSSKRNPFFDPLVTGVGFGSGYAVASYLFNKVVK